MDVIIRCEEPGDEAAVRAVNLAAFPEPAEANLVDALRANGKATISLVAVGDAGVIGHILFSQMTMESNTGQRPVLGLGPMAVHPDVQRVGVGSRLVTAGLDHCRRSGTGCVVVLGHPGFYPRFGFVPAGRFGISSEYNVADPYFMVIELADGALGSVSGQARYQPEFAGV